MSTESKLLESIVELYQNQNLYKIIVCDDDTHAQSIEKKLRALSKDFLQFQEIISLPGFIQTGVYKYESSKKLIAKRLNVAHQLEQNTPRILITSVSGFSRAFPSQKWINKNKLFLKINSLYEMEDLLSQLQQRVYSEVQHVEEVGEYAVRGSIVDLWSPGESSPTRIEFFDDTISKIKSFRAYDQKSFENKDSITILPSREFIWPTPSELDAKCEIFNTYILKQKIEGISRSNLLEDLKSSIPFPGIDDVSYMFSERFPTLLDVYKSALNQKKHTSFKIDFFSSKKNLEHSIKDIIDLYQTAQRGAENENLLVAKSDVLFPGIPTLNEIIINSNSSCFFEEPNEGARTFVLPHEIEESLINTEKETLETKCSKLKKLLENNLVKQVYLCSENKDSAFEILGLCAKYFPEISHNSLEEQIKEYSFLEIFKDSARFTKAHIIAKTLNLEKYFFLPNSHTLYLSENILRGRHISSLSNDSSAETENKQTQASQIFLAKQFSDFSEGDLVVHVQHGISRFCGLATINVGDIVSDFLVLEFAEKDKIYVPVNKLNLIQKYIGASSSISLDSLKSKNWVKRKEKIKKDVEEVAQKLLEHHAKQTITPGTAFSKIGEEYIAFEDAFPYEDTPDQQKATQDIMNDMSLPKAMDRLLCGDVGFGKTEVAMRACYRAILDGKQVAWLVPTTVLAHQHYRSLIERFSSFGVNVQLLDRATSAASKVLDKLAKGEIDILIGTHRILAKDIKFRDLGLLVVDEEQHFGVLQKEKIKTMSYGIDVLTLTATPIPRTLQMALVGIRDLSLLTTPPKSRLATKTFVCPFEDKTIVDAINFEIARGGQVFYVHNRVEELEGVKTYLAELLPNVRIAVGHGKMQQNQLEKTILEFLDRKFDLFLCTTIVEAGIDMPSVNTIIIQNSDNLGLAQLYQLRGRVGRRSTRGYAYFLVDSNKFSQSTDGMKRLEILKDHQELGSGFVIASHDLEMRGSGEILGDEQSGKVREIGLETYLQMLDDAIKQLGGVKVERKAEVDIQIPLSLQIPETYIESARERLLIYRRFFGARDESSLLNLIQECRDRFGEIPDEVSDLIEISRIRRLLLTIGAIALNIGDNGSECRLDQTILQSQDEHAEAFVKRVLDLCNRRSQNIRITQDGRLLFPLTRKEFLQDKTSGLAKIKQILSLLAGL